MLYLQVDEDTLRSRLASREGNDQDKTSERDEDLDVITIDATDDIATTINSIKQFHDNYIK